jgi:hypothetical protein
VLGVHPVKGVEGTFEQRSAKRAADLLLLDRVEGADALLTSSIVSRRRAGASVGEAGARVAPLVSTLGS